MIRSLGIQQPKITDQELRPQVTPKSVGGEVGVTLGNPSTRRDGKGFAPGTLEPAFRGKRCRVFFPAGQSSRRDWCAGTSPVLLAACMRMHEQTRTRYRHVRTTTTTTTNDDDNNNTRCVSHSLAATEFTDT